MREISDQVQGLLESVGEKTSSGKYLDQLRPESREVLDEFEQWLRTDDPNGSKSESTARAYKGYVAKAIVELEKDADYELDTDVKSAINALHRFKLAMAPAADPDDVELDDDEG